MDELIERLREQSLTKQGEAWRRQDGGQDLSIGAQLADDAADEIERLQAALKLARDCFLSMIAEARTWRENVDGDTDNNGRTVMYIDYDLNVRHSDLEELANAFGIENAWDETIKDAIDRELALPDGGHMSAQPAPGCMLAPVVHVPDDKTASAGEPKEMESNTQGRAALNIHHHGKQENT